VKKIYNVSSVIALELTDVIFAGRAQYKQHTGMLLSNRNCVFSFTSVQLIWIIRLPWHEGQYTSHKKVKQNGLQ